MGGDCSKFLGREPEVTTPGRARIPTEQMIRPSDAVARIIWRSWRSYLYRKRADKFLKLNFGEVDVETLYNEISAQHAETRKKISAKRKELGGFHFSPAPPLHLRGKRLPRKIFKNGNEYCEYTGEWKDNKPHGKGCMIWADGKTYDGYFAEGKKNGAGRMIQMHGEKKEKIEYYEGDFNMNVREGIGLLVIGSESVYYQGEWKAGKRHGNGREGYEPGDFYDGEFVDDKRHGNGTFKWRNGAVYKGEFLNGNEEGFGEYTWKNGRKYKGMWKDNTMDGEGIFTWPDGRSYVGSYTNNKKEGLGTYRWGDETAVKVYVGSWVNGQQHGKGKLTWGDGDGHQDLDKGVEGLIKDPVTGRIKNPVNGPVVFDSRENWTGPMLDGEWIDGKLNGTVEYREKKGDAIKTTKWQDNKLITKDNKLVAMDSVLKDGALDV